MRKNMKKAISFLLSLLLVFSILPNNMLQQEVYAAGSLNSPNYTNLVVFVNFSDTTHTHSQSGYGYGCCVGQGNAEATFKLFDGEDSNGTIINRRAMKPYLEKVSYGQLRLQNIFPQYNAVTNTMDASSLCLQNSASYYANNYDAMVTEIITWLNTTGAIPAGNTLDYRNTGILDNLMIVIPCESGNSNSLFGGLSTKYAGNQTFSYDNKNILIRNYNMVTESGVYFGISESGVLIHEFMHSLGYPDLYHRSGTGYNAIPVGAWDIMATESYRVQYPLAFMRQYISGWLQLPTLTTSQQSYTLTSASSVTEQTKNNQAVILTTPYSDTEFFVVEYRTKGDNSNQEYDSNIAGSGIIIYRVDTKLQTNFAGAPFMVYVFRQNDSLDSNGHEAGNGESVYLPNSYLSAESGRTSYGNSDEAADVTQNAITYTDGTNSGIVISNVGSASGDTITFDITFPETSSNDSNAAFWSTLTSGHDDEQTALLSSYVDYDGSVYAIKQQGISQSSSCSFYRFDENSGWVRLGNAPDATYQQNLIKYGEDFYTAYLQSDGYLRIAKWNGSTWNTVFTSSQQVTAYDMTCDETGIYFAYTVDSIQPSDTVYAYKYALGTVTVLGEAVCSGCDYASNLNIVAQRGTVVVGYREFFNNNQIALFRYTAQSNAWMPIAAPQSETLNLFLEAVDNELFFVANGTASLDYTTRIYRKNIADNSAWTLMGTEAFGDHSLLEVSVCKVSDVIYISYFDGTESKAYVKYYDDVDGWKNLGRVLTTDTISSCVMGNKDNQLRVVYLDTDTSTTFVRAHMGIEVGGDVPPPCTHEHTSLRGQKAATCGSTGYTGDKYCSDCGELISRGSSVAATGNHNYDAGVITKQPTTQATGIRTHTCTVCGGTTTSVIPMIVPPPCTHTNTSIHGQKTATCGTAGYTGDTYCSDCGELISRGSSVAATGKHNYDAGVITKQPTTQTTGIRTHSCTVCGGTTTSVIPMIVQPPCTHTNTSIHGQKAATCGTAGYTGDTYCSDCGELISRGSSVAATGNHNYDAGVITKQPTSHADGTRTHTCSVCGATTTSVVEAVVPDVSVSYQTHVQSYGWQDYVSNGAMSGTSGEAKRLEGIRIQLAGNSNLGVRYITHVQDYGWLGNSFNGGMSGTTGEAKRLEAIMIELYGADADLYDIYYRVHAQSYGWLGWSKNGAPAGTAGYAKRLEGIQIVVVKKGQNIDANMGGITSAYGSAYVSSTGDIPHISSSAGVTYQTHVQSYGWQNYVSDGSISGTFGEAKRLEGIHIRLTGQPYSGSIRYTTHVQSYGWQGDVNNPSTWKSDGEMAGTSGEAKRLEAICICLTGEMAEHYDVYYRVHAQSVGWMGWAKNDQMAGTAGYAYRLEAIQIVLVPKGGAAPGSTENMFMQRK